jgi:cystathionine gamma-synthase
LQAIHAALRLSRRRRLDAGLSGGNAVVFGFPYLDTLKMCGRPELSDGVDFLGFGDARDLDMLRFMLKSRAQSSGSNDAGVAAVFTEFPSNPLLQAPDLGALRELADEYGFLLVADDTIGTFANVDLLSSGAADVICTSLTKLYSGSGNVMAGSCIVGSTNPGSAELARLMREVHGGNTGDLYGLDAGCLVNNARDFEDRNRAINETAERLAGWLGERAEVKQVYYPNVRLVGVGGGVKKARECRAEGEEERA